MLKKTQSSSNLKQNASLGVACAVVLPKWDNRKNANMSFLNFFLKNGGRGGKFSLIKPIMRFNFWKGKYIQRMREKSFIVLPEVAI